MPKNTQPPYTIRTYTSEDYPALLTLWEKAGLSVRPEGRDRRDTIARELEHGVGCFFLAETDRELIGVVLATHDGRKGWINRLAVLPEYRHQGIAVDLVQRAEAWIECRGIEIITCLIEDYNTRSMEFFQKAGYVRHDDIIYFSKRKNPET